MLNKISTARVQDHQVKVPTVDMTCGKKELRLIGMSHLGSADYLNDISEEISSLASHTVLSEGLEPPAENGTAILLWDYTCHVNSLLYHLARYQGWNIVNQSSETFPLPAERTRNGDMDSWDTVGENLDSNGFKRGGIAEQIEHAKQLLRWLLNERYLFPFSYFKDWPKATLTNRNISAPTKNQAICNKVKIDLRDETVVKKIIDATEDRLIVPWGAAHIFGIVKKLKNLDWKYKEGSLKYRTAITIPERYRD